MSANIVRLQRNPQRLFEGVSTNPRAIDFDLYVDLLVLHFGFTRPDAEREAIGECWRDGLLPVRSAGAGVQP
jgi:hypothetical protein